MLTAGKEKMRGIDVSSYQGNIDWETVKNAGVEFAILKVIRKDLNPDKQFETNWRECMNAGIKVQGVYNYTYAITVDKAVNDATRVIQILSGRKAMVWLDVEDTCLTHLGHTLIDIINAYKAVIEAAECTFGVYTGLCFYESYIKPYAADINCPFWIARYPSTRTMNVQDNPDESKTPAIAHTLYGWQYSSAGSVPGINGNVDMDFYYEENETIAPVQCEKQDLGNVDVRYAAYTDKWWPEVINRNDWAGKGDNYGIKALAIGVSKGTVKYRVHIFNGDWLPFVTGYDINDYINGFAGNLNQEIDAIQAIFYTPEGYFYKYLHYMVSVKDNPKFYSEQIDDCKTNGMDGHAGIIGKAIDKFQCWVE